MTVDIPLHQMTHVDCIIPAHNLYYRVYNSCKETYIYFSFSMVKIDMHATPIMCIMHEYYHIKRN